MAAADMEEKKKAIVIQQFDDTLEVLQELNFKVMEADDCIDGIRKTIRYNPDLVITEINTPNLTGLSMANILGMLKIDTPIVLTAQTNKYAKAAAAFSNVIGCIPDKQIPFKLKPTLIGGLKNYKIDEDLVYPYALRQHEWADMMGLQGRKRILLVEDEEYVRKAALVKIDKADEYALFTAEDGLDGILKALLINPDLILADIKMPVLDGLAMSQLFFILNKPFPIVFLTASESESTRKKAQKIDSVIGYMTKKEMRAGKAFLQKIAEFIQRAETLKVTLEATYQKGDVKTLDETDHDYESVEEHTNLAQEPKSEKIKNPLLGKRFYPK